MWTRGRIGVFLQRAETPENNKVIIKLLRGGTVGPQSSEFNDNITSMVLHIKIGAVDEYKLEYDPWSDMDINSDQSIDERDVNVITQLSLAFYHQTVIMPGSGIILSLGVEDLVDVFDPDMPIEPLTPPKVSVLIEVLDMEDGDQPELYYSLTAVSLDEGASFRVQRVNPYTGPTVFPELEDLVKSFIKIKL